MNKLKSILGMLVVPMATLLVSPYSAADINAVISEANHAGKSATQKIIYFPIFVL